MPQEAVLNLRTRKITATKTKATVISPGVPSSSAIPVVGRAVLVGWRRVAVACWANVAWRVDVARWVNVACWVAVAFGVDVASTTDVASVVEVAGWVDIAWVAAI